jgi:hypothetical protein
VNDDRALRSRTSLSVATAVITLFAVSAHAQVTPAAGGTPPDDTPSIRVGTVIYTDFTYQDEPKITDADKNSVNASSFNVSRAYINVLGNLSHLLSFRVTGDISRETGTGASLAGSLEYRLKYAFGQVNFDDFLTHGSWARLGLQQTPYVDYMEGIYRYRFQGTIFEEREGFLSSSDFGLSAHYNFPGNYGDLHMGVYNGDTYTRADPNNQKAFQIRGTLRPLPLGGAMKGLRLTAFYDADNYIKNGPRDRFIANATFEHKYANAGVDWTTTKDQTSATAVQVKAEGWGGWITPKFWQKRETLAGGAEGKIQSFEGLLRYDSLKPNKNVDARRNRLIVGLAYWFPVLRGPVATIMIDMDQQKFDTLLNTPTNRKYELKAQFNY